MMVQCDSVAQVCAMVSIRVGGPLGHHGMEIPCRHPSVRVAVLLLVALLRN